MTAALLPALYVTVVIAALAVSAVCLGQAWATEFDSLRYHVVNAAPWVNTGSVVRNRPAWSALPST